MKKDKLYQPTADKHAHMKILKKALKTANDEIKRLRKLKKELKKDLIEITKKLE